MTWGIRLGAAAIMGWTLIGGTQQVPEQKPTTVIRFSIDPAALPHVFLKGACGPSAAAWFRTDARGCTAGSNVYDPCFAMPAKSNETAATFLCNVDPRKPTSGVFVEDTLTLPHPRTLAPSLSHTVWLFELADGTTCRPLLEGGREVERLVELYTCTFGTDGHADGVLGELESSQPIWTIRKVLINKKTDPQTIKSFVIAPVKTVWQ